MSAASICTRLRSKSALRAFASAGKFLGLEVYEQGVDTGCVPEKLTNGEERLFIRVPECGGSYFLQIQLDENFEPAFQLIEARPDSSGKAEFPDILNQKLRVKKIDVGRMNILEQTLSPSADIRNVFLERIPKVNIDPPSNFSLVVDELFGLEEVAPTFSGNHSAQEGSSSDILSKNKRKRSFTEILKKIRILHDPEESGFIKKRNTSAQASSQTVLQTDLPSNVYGTVLLHVVRHCLLCMKHAKLTSQLDAMEIPYFEELGLDPSPSIWFSLSVAGGNTVKNICLRVGRPGGTSWDVKIKDKHFIDIWDLQKGNNNKTPWGPGVVIASTSSLDSHIHCDPEGVVISYQSVEPCSIRKLVADIQRLSNARMFAIRMRKLLADEKLEDSGILDKLFEEMRKTFKIEAVGLMSLSFSLRYGSLALFSVQWEAEKQGCTVHVSPDHLWPHTKFLEKFINERKVAYLLDCIRLAAGPLHALAAATHPAQASLSPSTPAMVRPSIVQSSLLPIDVSVVLRGPCWIRIIYHKHFAVDIRCYAGDQVWLQPATPPKGRPSVGGSFPCPQFRPFIMEQVAQELKRLCSNFSGGQQNIGLENPNLGSESPGKGVLANVAIVGLGDGGGYGGVWVPRVTLEKVLREVLNYLGVLWVFAQLPDIVKEVLGSNLNENEGALLNLDQEKPALLFFIGGYMFAICVHKAQLLLKVTAVVRFHQQQQNVTAAQAKLTMLEVGEILDYFNRRVASEPYNASRFASFITLLTLPIPVLREFVKLMSWKKRVVSRAQAGQIASDQKHRIELRLENHSGLNMGITVRSNIFYNRPHNSVDFALTVVLDPAQIPQMNSDGGAAWLPYCVSVRLRFSFGGFPSVIFLGMEGSHGGRACWLRIEDWEKCIQEVAKMVQLCGSFWPGYSAPSEKLMTVAIALQRTIHLCLRVE